MSRRYLVFLVAAAIWCLACSPAAAKSYRITRVAIEADLHPDGSLSLSERRTYSFDGSFSFAYRDLPATGPVTFDGFELLENDRPYDSSGSHQPGTYDIQDKSGLTRLTWYFDSADEERTFELRYNAHKAVERYQDAAVLYFKFIGDEWDVPQKEVSLSIGPPSPVSGDSVKVWLHGPLWAYSRIEQNGVIVARCEHLPPHNHLEVRALYPPAAFPGVELRAGFTRPEIMAVEAKWAEEANRARENAKRKVAQSQRLEAAAKWVIPPIILAAFLVWWFIYRAFSNRPTVPRLPSLASEIPDKTSPALVDYLLHGRQVSASALVATMLDLAERGFLSLHQETTDVQRRFGGTKKKQVYRWQVDRGRWRQHAAELAEFERSLLAFVFDEVGKGGDSVAMDQMNKARRAFTKFYRRWHKAVVEQGRARQWYDAGSIRGMYYSLILGAALIGLTALLAFFFRLWVVPLGAAAITTLLLSLLIPHRTLEGETRARQWKAVQRYLRTSRFRTQSGPGLPGRISRYLVYGAVLGLSPKAYGELAGLVPEAERGTYLHWYVFTGSGGFSPEAFGTAFSSMVAATSSSMSSAAGAGGGASGGGGGGAGGGGGGAG